MIPAINRRFIYRYQPTGLELRQGWSYFCNGSLVSYMNGYRKGFLCPWQTLLADLARNMPTQSSLPAEIQGVGDIVRKTQGL